MFRAVLAGYSAKPALSGGFFVSLGVHAAVIAAAVGGTMRGDDAQQRLGPEERVAVYLAPYPSQWRAPQPQQEQLVWRGVGGGQGEEGKGDKGDSKEDGEGTGRRSGDDDLLSGLSIPQEFAASFEGFSDSVYFGFQVDNPAALDATSAAPIYPDSLRLAGVEGEVIAQFVVDTTGRVERESFLLLSSTHRLFTQSVQQALAGMRFRPAELGGQRIRQLVQVPFLFRLEPGLQARRDSTDSMAVAKEP